MLGDIQKAGGIGGLRKVDKSEIRDRSSVQGGGGDSGGGGSATAAAAGGAAAGGGGSMADALAAALQKRKDKVAKSGKFTCSRLPCFCGTKKLIRVL